MSDSILAAARSHFARLGNQTVEVPEWGEEGAPLIVYFSPLTMRARQNLSASAKGSDAQAAILVVIRHAKDAEGNRMFTDDAATRKALDNEVDPAVIGRIASAILGATDPDDLGE